KRTPEVRAKISAKAKGRTSGRGLKRSPESCKRISEAQLNLPPEIKERMRIALSTRVVSDETRRKISEARKLVVGWKHAEETKAKIGRKGESNSQSKLTEIQVSEIRRLYETGTPQRQIALRYGVNPQ